MAKSCMWASASDRIYEYKIFPIGNDWDDVPGNYIFAKKIARVKWEAIYIGETESFKDRLPNHNELPCIRKNGGTHIHIHVNRESRARLAEEADLLVNNKAPCKKTISV